MPDVQFDQMMNGDGFRFYRYDPGDGGETVDLLSVTSIRNLCGEGFNLVNWKMANLADAALGTMKRTKIGPRGGVSEIRQVFEFPSEFARKYDATKGDQGQIDLLRKWLREQADEPRNIAAVRGTLVHEAIEKNVQWDRIERPYVESAFAEMSSRDRAKVKRAINDDDVSFVRNGVRQYWDMRATVPMLILAREVRVANLSVGYAGTFDALVWLLGDFSADGTFVHLPESVVKQVTAERVTVETVAAFGGSLALLDWKTSAGIHTDQVIQAHAYLASEFVVVNGRKDPRLTALLKAAMAGGLVHIRPSGWGLHLFHYEDEVVRAFIGSVAFARLLAKYPKPDGLFKYHMKGVSSETEEAA